MQFVLVKILENTYIYLHKTHKRGFIIRMAHMALEAKKSYILPSGSSRTRKAYGVIQTKSNGLKKNQPRVGGGVITMM